MPPIYIHIQVVDKDGIVMLEIDLPTHKGYQESKETIDGLKVTTVLKS